MRSSTRIAERARLRRLVLMVVFVVAVGLSADEWTQPSPWAMFSPDGLRLLRLEPGCSTTGSFGYDCPRRGEPALVELFQRQRDHSFKRVARVLLENPIAPERVLLTNDGELITFDNWHEMGYGKVVAIYDRRGKRVASYELKDLFTAEEIGRLPRSVSSVEWRCLRWDELEVRDHEVHVPVRPGGQLVFNLRTGAFRREASGATCEDANW